MTQIIPLPNPLPEGEGVKASDKLKFIGRALCFVAGMRTYYYRHFKIALAVLLPFLNLSLITFAQTPKPNVTFEEVPAKKSGITWVHNNAHSTDRYLPETVGTGCAFFDYDNDGWMDIYLVNSGPSDFYTPSTPLKNALYHNNHDGTFTDVTDKAGVAGGTFGMGVAAGDYDGDGWVDLYITSYGRNILYHNNGNGTFTDVTDKAGVVASGWSTCAVWFDFEKALLMPKQGGMNNLRYQPYRIFSSRGHSGDPRISCVACHDPHDKLAEDAAFYDSKCLACHLTTRGQAKTALRSAPACPVSKQQCTTCHMPKIELPGAHGKFTDHWIRIVKPGELAPK